MTTLKSNLGKKLKKDPVVRVSTVPDAHESVFEIKPVAVLPTQSLMVMRC